MRTETTQRQPNIRDLTVSPQRLSSRFLWLFSLATVWMVGGLQLDGYYHATAPATETFFTAWHLIMYLGIFATVGVVTYKVRSEWDSDATSLRDAIPNGLFPAVVGIAVIVVSGGVDSVWHIVFGIEQDLEILVSPSHLGIVSGMALVSLTPMLALDRHAQNLRTSDRVLVVASASLALSIVLLFTLHATVLNGLNLGPEPGVQNFYLSSLELFHGFIVPSAFFVIPAVWLHNRYSISPLAQAGLAAFPALALWAVMSGGEHPVVIVLPPVAAFVAAVLLKKLRGVIRVDAISGAVLGGLFPAVLWALYFVAAGLSNVPRTWNAHFLSGVYVGGIFVGAVTGACTVLIGQGLRVQSQSLRDEAQLAAVNDGR